jgi:hypothetical protein
VEPEKSRAARAGLLLCAQSPSQNVCSNKVQKRATLPPHLLPIRDANFSLTMDGELRLAGRGSILFWEEAMARLTLRKALASNRLDAFVREQQDDGAELTTGSELERGLALLITQRRSLAEEGRLAHQSSKHCADNRHGCP